MDSLNPTLGVPPGDGLDLVPSPYLHVMQHPSAARDGLALVCCHESYFNGKLRQMQAPQGSPMASSQPDFGCPPCPWFEPMQAQCDLRQVQVAPEVHALCRAAAAMQLALGRMAGAMNSRRLVALVQCAA